jgi:hypothetical protein
VANLDDFLLAQQLDRRIGQVTNDRFDVAADIADFGELGRFDLDERRIGVTSTRSSSGSCIRRQRLRRAMATARLASSWPMMWRLSSWTISRGVMDIVFKGPQARMSRGAGPKQAYSAQSCSSMV